MLYRHNKAYISILLSLLVFLVLVTVTNTVLPGAKKIQVIVQLDHVDRIQVFYGNGLRKREFSEKHTIVSQPIEQYRVEKIRFKPNNVPVRKLRVDLGEKPGVVRIFKLTLSSFFTPRVDLSPKEIQRLFTLHPAGTVAVLENNYLQILTSTDTYLKSREPILRLGWSLHYGLPLIFAFLTFFVLQQITFSQFLAITDIYSKHPTSGDNINALDGLRGIAVLMVIAEHTWPRFSGLGISGVWIFMTLSGFLLARPFVLHPDRALSIRSWQLFFMRRVQRIVPVYYLYIIIVFLVSGLYDDAIRHFLFVQGSGHLWVVPQEMLFYLVTPGLMLCNALIFRGRPLLIAGNLALLMILANRFLTVDVFYLYGMNNIKIQAYAGIFFAGVIASYIYYGDYTVPGSSILKKKGTETFFAILVILILFFFFACSNEQLWGGYRRLSTTYFSWFGVGAALLILSILQAGKSIIIHFLSWVPLRAISVVSFSIYIFHTLVIDTVRKMAAWYFQEPVSGPVLFLWTLCLTYLLACFTYSLVERPFTRH